MEKEKFASIQVAMTKKEYDNESINVVETLADEPDFHSVYLRNEDGESTFVEDFHFVAGDPSVSRNAAYVLAAKLSMVHQIPVEPFEER